MVQHDDAGVVGPDRQLILGQDHAVGLDPSELDLFQTAAVRHHSPRSRHGDGLTGGNVVGAADDLGWSAPADIDHAHAETVGVGVTAALEHLSDHEVLARADSVMLHALHLGAGQRQPLGQRGRIHRRSTVLMQPLQGNTHQPNCSRNRTSFS